MRYVDEFRDKKSAQSIARGIAEMMPDRRLNIMEVCGTHTHNFYRFGIDKLMPANLKLISGPGCPVCVSPAQYIDAAVKIAKEKDVVIVTFADMLRVPGTKSSLEKEKAQGKDINMAYSPLDALKHARQNPRKKIIFLAVGFETTAPAIAITVKYAKEEGLKNIFFLTALRTIIPAMDYLLEDNEVHIDGFLCPGHVSSIIGLKPYGFIPKKYGIGCCIAGFEPLDILEGLYFLIKQIVEKKPVVSNQYARAVTYEGNTQAQRLIREVFGKQHSYWRGLGKIPASGLALNDTFSRFDAEKEFHLSGNAAKFESKNSRCRCGQVLKGLISPKECGLFGKSCTPEHAFGPCMVSSEGACYAHYKYR